MRSLAVLLALAGVVGIVWADGTTLTGVLKDANGKAMEGVIVRIAPADRTGGYRPMQTKTDEKGRFTIEGAESGAHSIGIQVLADERFAVDLPEIELKGKKQDVQLRLSKSEVTGRITLKDTGKPPAESPQITFNVVKPWNTAGMAWSDKDGKYRWRGFPPGKFRVYVNLAGYRKGKLDIEVKKNKKLKGVDFVLEPLESGTVRFTVKDAKGMPIEGVRFSYDSEPGISSTLHAKPVEDEPGVYACTQLETGDWKVYISCEGMKVAVVKVKVKAGKTTEIATTLEPK